MTSQWTDDRVEMLRGMWRQGYSARQIAERIGGITRNAVIGKAHRLGLSQRPQAVKRKVIVAPIGHERTCQWPLGDPGEKGFHFCGGKATTGKPYCEAHCIQAYRRASD